MPTSSKGRGKKGRDGRGKEGRGKGEGKKEGGGRLKREMPTVVYVNIHITLVTLQINNRRLDISSDWL